MPSISLVLVGLALGWVAPSAQAQGRPTATAAVSAELVRAERAVLAAIVARDSSALERWLAPTFQLVSAYSQGEVMTRRDWLHGVLDRRSSDGAELAAPVVTVHGPGVATVVSHVTWSVREEGSQAEREELLVTDTWVSRNRRWQLASRHSSKRRSGMAP